MRAHAGNAYYTAVSLFQRDAAPARFIITLNGVIT